MGLFLQKTNIIRDYLEDLHDGRTWWPRDVWSKYAPSLASLAEKCVARRVHARGVKHSLAHLHMPRHNRTG